MTTMFHDRASRAAGLAAASAQLDTKLAKAGIGNGVPPVSTIAHAKAIDGLRRANATASEITNTHVGRADAAIARSYFGGK